jgi:flavin reductase (DIM6/NTAB) family NADH-FMN oxidoreductase RutF
MNEEAKKVALRMINYGMYVLTAKEGENIGAATVNWLSQTSFKPPLVMVGVKADSYLHSLIDKTRAFAVNILGSEQKNLAAEFFKPIKVEGRKINGTPYEIGMTGSPILMDTPASFECKLVDMVKRGDHTIVVGEVVEAHVRRKEAEPLFMRNTGWFYGG